MKGLPRRTAHAAWALLYAAEQLKMPPTSEEVCLYDEEAGGVDATAAAAALRHAQVMGLAVYVPPKRGDGEGIWAPTQAALGLRSLLEERYLADTAETL